MLIRKSFTHAPISIANPIMQSNKTDISHKPVAIGVNYKYINVHTTLINCISEVQAQVFHTWFVTYKLPVIFLYRSSTPHNRPYLFGWPESAAAQAWMVGWKTQSQDYWWGESNCSGPVRWSKSRATNTNSTDSILNLICLNTWSIFFFILKKHKWSKLLLNYQFSFK